MKKTILKIGGTNGSGKSTIPLTLLQMFDSSVLARDGMKERLRLIELPQRQKLIVLGSYHTQCGGCDGIQPYSDILDWLGKAVRLVPDAHVLMEGSLITCHGTLGEYMQTVAPKTHAPLYAVMGTPLDVCIRRVNERRALKGKGPLEDTKNVDSKHRSSHISLAKLAARGLPTKTIDYRKPVVDVLSVFGITLPKEPRHG